MCGIAGLAGRRPVNEDTVHKMTDLLVHRGPDDCGYWRSSNGTICLGHRRLSIIDTSAAGHQPMVKDPTVITYNGELYNYLELRARLQAEGVSFTSSSDTEVILEAYRMWGDQCLNEFNGMFAFALYDADRDLLFCARDRFGEKPFLYSLQKEAFAFASEYKSLLNLEGVSQEIDPFKLLIFLDNPSVGLDDEEETVFPAIKQLLPAHSLTLNLKDFSVTTMQYWTPKLDTRISTCSQGEIEDAFSDLLTDSVRIRMRSDVPVGSCLSGGLDSSSIVGLIQEKMEAPAAYAAFTGRFEDTPSDEWEWAKEVLGKYRITSHVTNPDVDGFLAELPDFLWHNELPVGSTSQFAQWSVFRLAKEHGVTVLLDGQGADELLGGYEQYFSAYLAALAETQTPAQVKQEANAIRTRYPLALLSPTQSLGQSLPGSLRHLLARITGKGSDFKFGLAPDLASRLITRTSSLPPPPPHLHPLTKALWQESHHTHLPVLLRYGDRNSMAHSEEVRLPFCDHRLAEFTLSLPPEALMGDTQTKRVLRGAMKGILPEPIRKRWNKQGFLPPQSLWFRQALRDQTRDIIESREFQDSGLWQRSWWRHVLKRFDNGEDHLASMLWRPFIEHAWRQHFLQRIQDSAPLRLFQEAP